MKCAGEVENDDLEGWRLESGAQRFYFFHSFILSLGFIRCPTCLKIIEKDDPDTCNHMVHKSTDPIPCDMERTDFCCFDKFSFIFSTGLTILLVFIDLCGTEVTKDYPHEEMDNPGVNHFQDGVFQDCRVVKEEKRVLKKKKKKRKRLNSRIVPLD